MQQVLQSPPTRLVVNRKKPQEKGESPKVTPDDRDTGNKKDPQKPAAPERASRNLNSVGAEEKGVGRIFRKRIRNHGHAQTGVDGKSTGGEDLGEGKESKRWPWRGEISASRNGGLRDY